MFSIECAAGRLVETRLVTPVTEVDILQADTAMAGFCQRFQAQLVVAADYRKASVLSEAQAADLAAVFRRHNDRIERSAILASEQSATAVLQLARVLREAKLPERRAFKYPMEAEMWLGEVLSDRERQQLRLFLTL